MNALSYLTCGWSWRPWGASEGAARPPITREETREVLHYAFATPAIHLNSWNTWLEPSGYRHINPRSLGLESIPGQIEVRDTCFFDPETALKVALFQKGNQLLVVFGALNSSHMEVDEGRRTAYMRTLLYAGGYNLVWGRPLVFQRAVELLQHLKQIPQFQHLDMVLTGHSFGGGIASYLALKLNNRAICFNALPMGSWVKTEVGAEGLTLADRHITQVIVEGDWLSDNILIRNRELFSRVITLPFIPGRKVFVPTAYPTNTQETHAYIVGSLQEHVGIDKCEQPASVVTKL